MDSGAGGAGGGVAYSPPLAGAAFPDAGAGGGAGGAGGLPAYDPLAGAAFPVVQPTTEYEFEEAKSGRASCKAPGCGLFIKEGSLRVKKSFEGSHGMMEGKTITHYYHPKVRTGR
jgi:hypothetical protein